MCETTRVLMKEFREWHNPESALERLNNDVEQQRRTAGSPIIPKPRNLNEFKERGVYQAPTEVETPNLTVHWRFREGPPRIAICGATGDIAMVGYYFPSAPGRAPLLVNCSECKAKSGTRGTHPVPSRSTVDSS